MHIRVAHETCVRVQVVFNAIPAAEKFLQEIRQRDDIFLATSTSAMVFFYTFNERIARSLALDFERRWLERLISGSTPLTQITASEASSTSEVFEDPVEASEKNSVEASLQKPVKNRAAPGPRKIPEKSNTSSGNNI